MAGQGYDVATDMAAKVDFFANGGLCATGYVPLNMPSLRPKPNLEFGSPTEYSMPDIAEFSISVVYSIASSLHVTDEDVFDASIMSVIERLPSVAELVVVFSGTSPPPNRERLQDVIDANRKDAPFPIKVVDGGKRKGKAKARRGGGGGREEGWSRLLAAEFCKGDFVLHLDPGEILVDTITYDHVFHFGRPVLPFGRYGGERICGGGGGGGWGCLLILCNVL